MGRAYSVSVGGEPGVFGPQDIQAIVAAFEALLKDFGLTDRTDPATMMLARLTFEVAQQGKFDAASLRTRVLEVMKANGRRN
jgi:hypothetical protein